MSRPKLRVCDEGDAYMNRQDDILQSTKPGGSDGDGTMDNLEKRVTNLEGDVKVIRNDLTTIIARSDNFATKADITEINVEITALRGELRTEIAKQGGDIRTEMAKQGGDLSTEMAKLRGELKTEMAAMRGEVLAAVNESQQSILRALDEKSKWKLGSVFIPLGVGIVGVIATLLAGVLSVILSK